MNINTNLADDFYINGNLVDKVYLRGNQIWPFNYEQLYFTIYCIDERVDIGCSQDLYYATRNVGGEPEWIFFKSYDEELGRYNYIHARRGNTIRIKSDINNFTSNSIEFDIMGQVEVYGNILSLLYGDVTPDQYTLPNDIFNNTLGFSDVVYANNLVLPTNLSNGCFMGMFDNCHKLIYPPRLKSTILTDRCYKYMFRGCENLLMAPKLLAPTLVSGCYEEMFKGCEKIKYIQCLATNISATNCLTSWLYNVSPTGTFVKKTGVTWPTGDSGIPTGWTVINV